MATLVGIRAAMLTCRDDQNQICTPCMTVYLVIYLPKTPYIHRIYMVLASPIDVS